MAAGNQTVRKEQRTVLCFLGNQEISGGGYSCTAVFITPQKTAICQVYEHVLFGFFHLISLKYAASLNQPCPLYNFFVLTVSLDCGTAPSYRLMVSEFE